MPEAAHAEEPTENLSLWLEVSHMVPPEAGLPRILPPQPHSLTSKGFLGMVVITPGSGQLISLTRFFSETQPRTLVKNLDSGATLPAAETQVCSRKFLHLCVSVFAFGQEAGTRVRWVRRSPQVPMQSRTNHLTDQGQYFNAILKTGSKSAPDGLP